MGRVRLCFTDALTPLAIPIPNQIRIVYERLRRCQFRRIKISPVTILAPESRDPAFRGNARAGDYENTTVKHIPRCCSGAWHKHLYAASDALGLQNLSSDR